MPPSLFPLPLLLLPPENPDQLDLFGQPSVSVPFHEVHAWTGGIAPGSIRKAVRHELRRRGVRQGDLASRIGVSRSQLTNILDGRFGAGPAPAGRLVFKNQLATVLMNDIGHLTYKVNNDSRGRRLFTSAEGKG